MKIPKKVTVVPVYTDDVPCHKIFVDNDEFPYATKVGSLSVEPVTNGNTPINNLKWVTITFLLDGEVEIPETYKS